jgi:hypothetical protein
MKRRILKPIPIILVAGISLVLAEPQAQEKKVGNSRPSTGLTRKPGPRTPPGTFVIN